MDPWQPLFLMQLLVGGLLAGALYALLACGLNLIFGVMGVINLAQAELMLLGAFGTWIAHTYWHWPILAILPVVAILLFLLGGALQRLLVERVVGKDELVSLLVTYGLAILLKSLGLWFFSADFKSVPALQGSWILGEVAISRPRGIAGLLALAITVGVYLFLQRSRLGKAIRAVAEQPEVAMICGIDAQRIRMLTFGLAAAMAGVAGGMLATIYAFSPESGGAFLLKSFVIIVLGGVGDFVGAFLGAILLGVTESLVSGWFSSQWAEAASYFLLVAVLLLRPSGLRGRLHAR